MAQWHQQCNEHELGQTSRDGKGQGSLAYCRPWGHRIGHDWVAEQLIFCKVNLDAKTETVRKK